MEIPAQPTNKSGSHLNTARENSAERFDRILAAMAAETPEARVERWQGLFDKLADPYTNLLVLFGTGELGNWILGRLRKVGVEPLCFVDNNHAKWGGRVQDIEVLSPSDAVQRFGQTACFIVTIYNGSLAREQLREMGCGRVLPAPLLFWKYPDEFMPDLGIDAPERLLEQAEQIRQCFSLLSDDQSRQELCDQIEWRYWMNPEYLPLPSNQPELYFPSDLVAETEQEVLVDCGAFDGDSIRSFMRRGQSFRHLYALEPDAANLTGLHAFISNLRDEIRERVTVWPYAVGDKDEQVNFVESHDVTSKISSSSEGITIESRCLDSLPWRFKPTYIKMDIEGSEPLALAGGAELLRSELPVLAVCLYHRTEHLWQIPNLIHSLAPAYSFYLRRYAEDCWEQVCYAVPRNRVKIR
jgi:FkbM family methyltransferase